MSKIKEQHNPRYKWYVLTILTIVYMFNFIDRQILVILQEPIKAELGLSDTQLGLLTGFAFIFFYTILGLPLARLADIRNRKKIVAASLVIWSSMTALMGSVTNFMQLLLTRIGVGIGEAGCSPAAHSIISDYFPPENRATALSIYSMGIYLGVGLGFIVGGLIAASHGWRIALYSLGISGVLFSIVVYLTIKEPIRGQTDQNNIEGVQLLFGEAIKKLLCNKTFIYLSLACGFHTFMSSGVGNFLPSFLHRVHGFDIAHIGIVLGITSGLGGAIGIFAGGYLADKLRTKDMRWYIWIPMIASLLNTIPTATLIFSNNADLVIWVNFFYAMLTAVFLGPAIAVSHSLVSAKMRALTSAVLFFIICIIGPALGPLVVGYLSDILTPTYGDLSLRYAYIATFMGAALSMIMFVLASKSYIDDLNMFKTTN